MIAYESPSKILMPGQERYEATACCGRYIGMKLRFRTGLSILGSSNQQQEPLNPTILTDSKCRRLNHAPTLSESSHKSLNSTHAPAKRILYAE